MTDFAANIHFRASEPRPETALGGYAWFLGRYESWSDFETAIKDRLAQLGYYYVECLNLLEIADKLDLSDENQRAMYERLGSDPTQVGTLHLYSRDDA